VYDSKDKTFVSLPAIVGVVIFIGGMLSTGVLNDADTYWHVAVGRWILANGAIPTADPFSHSMPGKAWTAHEWLSEIVMFGVYRAAGWNGLQTLVSATFGLTAAYITRFLLRRMEPAHAVAMVAVSAALMFTHFLARPHAMVWPLTAVWIGTLVSAAEARKAPPWWLLGVLVLWANLHASFTLAVGFAGAIAADGIMQHESRGERIASAKSWAAFLAVCCVCLLANPQGFGALTYAVGVMRMGTTLAVVNEWQSANFQEFQVLLVWIMLLLALGAMGTLRLSPFRLLFVLGLIYLALKHQRYHALLGLVSPFLIALPLANGLRKYNSAPQAEGLDRLFGALALPARRSGMAAVALACVMSAVAVARALPSQPSVFTTPESALRAFQATGAKGKVFNAYGFGGYLIFNGVPVFIDGRSDMYGDSLMTSMGDALALRTPDALDSLLSRYDIGWTMLEPKTSAIELLDHMPAWVRMHADSIAVVHVRRDLLPATH
jgi:hypothetical protein